MGTLANGIKNIFSTAKTTGTNVMLCANDGTPDGHMTMSNLASALGVSYIRVFRLSGQAGAIFSSYININQGNGGGTALIISSTNTGANKNTYSVIGMLQFYHSGDYIPLYTKIAGGDIENFIEFGNDANGYLTFTKKTSSEICLSIVFSKKI